MSWSWLSFAVGFAAFPVVAYLGSHVLVRIAGIDKPH